MRSIAVPVMVGCFLVSPCVVQAKDLSMNLKVSTLGVGIEGEYSLNDHFSVRLGGNYFKYSYSGTESEINYDFDLNLGTVSALVDLHPFKGSFRLSAGALYNDNNLDANATSSTTYDIGNATYMGSQIGTLKGTIDFNTIAPYAGLGWDTSFGKESGWGFVFDTGVVFQGSPDVRLSADGPISTDPTFQQNLAIEESNLQNDLDNFEIYPVVALGVSYRF